MHILVNSIPMSGLLTGISRYLRALYQEIEKVPGVKVSYFNGRETSEQMPPIANSEKWIKGISFIWKLPDPVVFSLRYAHWLRYEFLLRRTVKKGDFDIYHETAFVPARITTLPVVYSVYDLSLITFRDKHPRERVWFNDFFLPRRLKYASHILTISEYIKNEINQLLGVPEKQISCAHLAPEQHFKPSDVTDTSDNLLKLNLPERFFLFVGSLEPRKNLDLIIKAMELQADPIPLVLTGWSGWGDKTWLDNINQGLRHKVITPGHVADNTLAGLYNRAQALIYPSLYEGFGLPVIEAMACGCPVICSNNSSLPEVAGDAAILIDPRNPEELEQAMDSIARDQNLRQNMAALGLKRAEMFSWHKTAQQTMGVFENVAWSGI